MATIPPPPPDPPSGDVIVGQVGEGARGVAVGKNIIQIERFILPLWLWALLLLLPLLLALLAWWALVPSRMPDDTFNVAVATFGEGEDGTVRPAARAARWSRQVAETLQRENSAFTAASSTNQGVTIWHDGMRAWQKRASVGAPLGTAAEREQAVEAAAARLNADVVIYGEMDGPTRLALRFYITPAGRAESAATLAYLEAATSGHYHFGEPVRVPNDPSSASSRLPERARSLFRLLLGLREDRVGEPRDVLQVLGPLPDPSPAPPTPGEGSEFQDFLLGKAALTLHQEAEAQLAFERAIAGNPGYVPALIGAGTVHHERAQCLLARTPPDLAGAEPEIGAAIARYERALAAAPPEEGSLPRAISAVALGSAYRLQGYSWLARGDYGAAEQWLSDGATVIEGGLPPLAGAGEYRLAGQGYALLGSLYDLRAWVGDAQNQPSNSEAHRQAARDAYAACVALSGEGDPSREFDAFLEEEIIARVCQPALDGEPPSAAAPLCE